MNLAMMKTAIIAMATKDSLTNNFRRKIMAPDATVMRAVAAIEAYWGQK